MVTRGYCRTREAAAALNGFGLPDKVIYLEGRGAEDLERCLTSFRDRPGRLVIAPDLRVFGNSRKAIAATVARLELAGIRLVDAIHPQHQTVAELLQHAFVLIAGSRFRDRRTARRSGRAGGLARGDAAQARRDECLPHDVVARLVRHPALTWGDVTAILGSGFSESTLRRHYLGAS